MQKRYWAANKRFEISKFKFKFPRARTYELIRARSRLYRSQILQVNSRWKALAEIYTMHSFAPFWNPQSKTGEKRTWPKQHRKGENERPLSSISLPSTSAKGGCEEKLTRMKIEDADGIWSPRFGLEIQLRCQLDSVCSDNFAKFSQILPEFC